MTEPIDQATIQAIDALTKQIAELMEKLKQERNKAIDECIDYFGEHHSEMGDDGSCITWTTFEVQKKLESLKDKSHE